MSNGFWANVYNRHETWNCMTSDKGKRAELLENEYEALYSVKELLESRRNMELSMCGGEAGYLEELLERTDKLLLKLMRERRNY